MKSSQVENSKAIYSKFAKIAEFYYDMCSRDTKAGGGEEGQALEDGGCQCVLDGGHRPRDAESRQTVEAEHECLAQ